MTPRDQLHDPRPGPAGPLVLPAQAASRHRLRAHADLLALCARWQCGEIDRDEFDRLVADVEARFREMGA